MNRRWILALMFLSSNAPACGAGGDESNDAIDFGTGDEGDDGNEGTILDALTARPGEKARVIANSGLNLRARPTTSFASNSLNSLTFVAPQSSRRRTSSRRSASLAAPATTAISRRPCAFDVTTAP